MFKIVPDALRWDDPTDSEEEDNGDMPGHAAGSQTARIDVAAGGSTGVYQVSVRVDSGGERRSCRAASRHRADRAGLRRGRDRAQGSGMLGPGIRFVRRATVPTAPLSTATWRELLIADTVRSRMTRAAAAYVSLVAQHDALGIEARLRPVVREESCCGCPRATFVLDAEDPRWLRTDCSQQRHDWANPETMTLMNGSTTAVALEVSS